MKELNMHHTDHCRIGSLEIIKQKHWQEANDHCRIGSLEI